MVSTEADEKQAVVGYADNAAVLGDLRARVGLTPQQAALDRFALQVQFQGQGRLGEQAERQEQQKAESVHEWGRGAFRHEMPVIGRVKYPLVSAIYNPGGHVMNDQIKAMADERVMELESGIAAFEAKHFAAAIRFLSPLAAAGEVEALYRMAIMAQNGLGMVADSGMALAYMTTAAEAGHALAQHGLGFMYMEGEGVSPDGGRAVHWFTRAAEQGLQGSMTTLGMMYREGRGVPADPEEAGRWFGKAGFDDPA